MRSPFLANLPNLITLARLVLVPVIIEMVVSGAWDYAFAAFLVAGLSDALDGFLAKRFDLRSELGAYLDPLADKALLVSLYITLAIVGAIPNYLAIVVVFRDILIVGAVILSWSLHKPVSIRPLLVSKLNTAAQIALVVLVLAMRAFDVSIGMGLSVCVIIVAALTIGSAAAYLIQWLRHMAE